MVWRGGSNRIGLVKKVQVYFKHHFFEYTLLHKYLAYAEIKTKA